MGAGFNPTMVRLLRSKTRANKRSQVGFNPTMVRLLRCFDREHPTAVLRFNPTMVRLLQLMVQPAVELAAEFQSHNGAIAATKCLAKDCNCAQVSIPQWCDCCETGCAFVFVHHLVSIPQWCDCCPEAVANAVRFLTVSIPQWCDCCPT